MAVAKAVAMVEEADTVVVMQAAELVAYGELEAMAGSQATVERR